MELCKPRYLLLASALFVSSELHARLAGELVNLPLEELMMLNISISSASKREQGYFDTPAPVSVLTADQLQQLGVTSIPEALRSFPGVQVGKIQTAGWSVSIRGLGGRFSRYLLILVDGRSVYDNLLNGVNWDEVNINIDDIDKIELVRGPSGMFWGANAVNGVINIITKKPTQIENNSIEIGAGNIQKHYFSAQMRHSFSDDTHVKLNANYLSREGLDYINLNKDEGQQYSQRLNVGLLHNTDSHQFDVAINLFNANNNETWQDTRIESVIVNQNRGYFNMDQEKTGYDAQIKWRYQLSSDQYFLTRMSYDNVDRTSSLYDSEVDNIDFDVEYNTRLGKHLLSLGVNNRYSRSDYNENNSFVFLFKNDHFKSHTNSFFVNDTVRLGDSFELSFGGRYEDDSLSGAHTQCSLRGLWSIDDNQRLWSAYSRSNSTPSRLLIDGEAVDYLVLPPVNLSEVDLDLSLLPPNVQAVVAQNYMRLIQPAPVILRGFTQGDHDNVVADSFELGYRSIINDRWVFEASAFYNEYENLIIPEVNTLGLLDATLGYITGLSPVIMAPILYNDSGSKSTAGVELSLMYKFNDRLSFQYSGDYINDFNEKSTSSDEYNLPIVGAELDNPAFNHRLNIHWQYSNNLSTNVLFRYVDSIPGSNLNAYAVADLSVQYKMHPNWVLSVVAQNLGDPHPESYSEGFSAGLGEYEQNVLFKLDYQWGEE